MLRSKIESLFETIDVKVNGDRPWDVKIIDEHLFNHLSFSPTLAIGEGFMKKQWDCERVDELIFRVCRNQIEQKIYNKWQIALQKRLNDFLNFQTRMRSKQVAEQHYNLGNEFYRKMLGETMAYSCGYWKNAQNLDQAQYNKFELISRKLQVKKGDRILDIGCGWGTLAKYLAEKHGCEVVAINISTEQVKFAQQINKNLPVQIILTDYRDDTIYNPSRKPFDKIVSVGQFEHVGFKNYNDYFQTALRNLKEEGLFLLHTIGKDYTSNYLDPWTDKYIFPNGVLPSVKLIAEAVENLFVIEDFHNFGADYDKTLMAWDQNFTKEWDKGLSLHYDETFYRLWRYYLLTCAGTFRARAMQLWQFVLSPKGVLGGYSSVR